MKPIETERCLLRPMTTDDREAVFAYRGDKVTNRYQGWIPDSLDDVDTWLGKRPPEINTPNTWFQLVIIDRKTQDLIGDIGLHFPKGEPDGLWVGCTLRKAAHGRGLATECLVAVLQFAHLELGKNGVSAWILEANTPSRKLFERLGFELVSIDDQSLCHYFRKLPL